ncbi:putative methyltransferase [Nymphaea thermarum]|nr:putative methyltransferase [Nymphaea thermarum]
MGGNDDYRKPSSLESRRQAKWKLKIVLLVVFSNLLTIYIFTGPFRLSQNSQGLSIGFFDDARSLLLRELNATQRRLMSMEAHVSEVQNKLHSSNNHLETLLAELNRLRESLNQRNEASNSAVDDGPVDGWGPDVPDEVKNVVEAHKLPLGFTAAYGADELYPPVGHACRRFKKELKEYMSYEVGGTCPVDDMFAQRLMLKGCEPLPRRRCHPKAPAGYVEPLPFPRSLWETPPDTSIAWDSYNCKGYQCLIDRPKNTQLSPDCKDCFDLQGRERSRWLRGSDRGLDYGIDEVLAIKGGSIRIGLDIGGGSGTFAARMRERNVTIVTTSMNFDGPFNNFIASRGLVPLYITVSHRLPFFDNTLDIVHSMHVLSNWIPDMMLEFTLFDIYRVLRPGGLFWLDHFFCSGGQLNVTYAPMFARIGFNKLRLKRLALGTRCGSVDRRLDRTAKFTD